MNLNSTQGVLTRLRRGKEARKRFIESHINKGLAFQLRATRDKLGWSQERLAEEVGMNQNAISRLESPDYGKPTLTTLKRLAAALDVGLVVRFVPLSEMVDWVSGTPRTIYGLNADALAVPSFDKEEADGVFRPMVTTTSHLAFGAMANPNTLRMTEPLKAGVMPATESQGVLYLAACNSGSGPLDAGQLGASYGR